MEIIFFFLSNLLTPLVNSRRLKIVICKSTSLKLGIESEILRYLKMTNKSGDPYSPFFYRHPVDNQNVEEIHSNWGIFVYLV